MIQQLFPHSAPTPRGPYTPVVRAGDFLFISGQGPVDPVTDQMVRGTIQEETERTLRNIEALLEAAGATLANVVKCNVYLRDIRDFGGLNEVYARFFHSYRPARTTVAAELPDSQMKVEIDCIAYLPVGQKPPGPAAAI